MDPFAWLLENGTKGGFQGLAIVAIVYLAQTVRNHSLKRRGGPDAVEQAFFHQKHKCGFNGVQQQTLERLVELGEGELEVLYQIRDEAREDRAYQAGAAAAPVPKRRRRKRAKPK